MALTPSNMLGLGTIAPGFSLPDVVSGRVVSLDTFKVDAPLLVMFICRHCPYVKHVQQELARVGRDYQGRAGIVAISANDAARYPDDAPGSLKEMAVELGFTFPFCYDERQDTARAYAAACTPDFFLFDHAGGLCIAASWTTAGLAAGSRSLAPTFARRSMPCWRAVRSRANSGPASAATSSGRSLCT